MLDQRLEETIRETKPKVVSFDFFDTTCLRKVENPTRVFWSVGQELIRCGILPRMFVPERFASLRIEAEKAARKRKFEKVGSHEVSLRDVYLEFEKLTGFSRGRIADLVAIEECVELKNLFLYDKVARLIDVCQSMGIKTIVTSDTYFSQGFLSKIFDLNNATAPDQFFVSCELGMGKGSGVWKFLLERLAVSPTELLHVGDNYFADIEAPAALGIRTFFMPHGTSELFSVVARERGFLHDRSNQYRPTGIISLRAKVHTESDSSDPYRAYGYQVLGPVFSQFSEWTTELAKHLQASAIVPLAREGVFLSQLLDSQKVRVTPPLSVSRRFMRLIDFRNPSREKLEALFSSRDKLSKRGFSNRLSSLLGLFDFSSPERDYDEPLTAADHKRLLDQLWGDRQKIEALSTKARSQAALFLKHLSSVFGDEIVEGQARKKVCLFDVGWNGSIQKFLATFCEEEGVSVDFVGAYLMTTPAINQVTLEHSEAYGFLVDGGAPVEVADLALRNLEIIEQSATPTKLGSFLDFTSSGATRESGLAIPEAQRTQVARLQSGILDFHAARRRLLPNDEFSTQHVDELRSILIRAMMEPSSEEAALFSAWRHDDNLGDSEAEPITDDMGELIEYYTPEGFLSIGMTEQYWPFPNLSNRPNLLESQVRLLVRGLANRGEFSTRIGALKVRPIQEEETRPEADAQFVDVITNTIGKSLVEVFLDHGTRSLEIAPEVPSYTLRLDHVRVDISDPLVGKLVKLDFNDKKLSELIEGRGSSVLAERFLLPGSRLQIKIPERYAIGRSSHIVVRMGFCLVPDAMASSMSEMIFDPHVHTATKVVGAAQQVVAAPKLTQGWIDTLNQVAISPGADGVIRAVVAQSARTLELTGWFLGANDTTGGRTMLVLESPNRQRFTVNCERFERNDIAAALGRSVPNDSGIRATLDARKVPRGVPLVISVVQLLDGRLSAHVHPHHLVIG